MSILIKGMEMPINCDKCIYSSWSNFYQIYVCNAFRKNEPVLFDGKQTKSTAVARSARADNCPLIPVPEHGRMIDADERIKKIPLVRYEIYENIRTLLESAPTVIPADPAKEGEE